jgi:DNA polymerase-3 subunit gamma/tau
VKFIFATTEIRKVPVTVLSRCQRFDLRRVSIEELAGHYGRIAEKENCKIDEKALAMIARASEGSVRDGLSLLDQAFAHGAGDVSEEQVRDMLGLADRALILDLYEMIMQGKTAEALGQIRSQYEHGADPAVVLGDMLELTHWLTRLKVVPDAGEDMVTSEAEREQGGKMAASLALPVLTRAWQMLLKALAEVRMASSPIAAAEMVIIRMTYAASLPNPADLVKQLRDNPPALASGGRPNGAPTSGGSSGGRVPTGGNNGAPTAFHVIQGSGLSALRVMDSQPVHTGDFLPSPDNFEELVILFEQQNEAGLAYNLRDNTHLESFEIGRMSFRLKENVPKDLIGRISERLKTWTGRPWMISLSQAQGNSSLYEQEQMENAALRCRMEENDLVKAILNQFKGAQITKVKKMVDDFLMGDGSSLSDYLVSEDEFGLDDDY